jgi:hypothetical protein
MARAISKNDDSDVFWVTLVLLIASVILFYAFKGYIDDAAGWIVANWNHPVATFVPELIPMSIIGIYGVLHWLFSRYFWRPFAVFLGVPVIDGTWEGEVTSDLNAEPIPVRAEVDQTWRSLRMEFQSSGDFRSFATLASFDEDSAANDRLKYLYTCLKNGQRDHLGTTVMMIHRDGTAEGVYYTDKNTPAAGAGDRQHSYASCGTIRLKKVPG